MIAFDTHAHVKRLIEAGFTEAQAEAHTRSLLELLETRLATKEDLERLSMQLTIRLGGMIIAAVGVLAAIRFFG